MTGTFFYGKCKFANELTARKSVAQYVLSTSLMAPILEILELKLRQLMQSYRNGYYWTFFVLF